jgi:hypothetical protein
MSAVEYVAKLTELHGSITVPDASWEKSHRVVINVWMRDRRPTKNALRKFGGASP